MFDIVPTRNSVVSGSRGGTWASSSMRTELHRQYPKSCTTDRDGEVSLHLHLGRRMKLIVGSGAMVLSGISTQNGLPSVVDRRAIMPPHEPRGERNRAKIRASRGCGVTFASRD